MPRIRKICAIVAISGGVDSSVAAAILKKRGFKVIGLYLQLFKDEKKEEQAKLVAKTLNIPLLVQDTRKEFEKKIINYFLREYQAGRTPNPCVVCNQCIKFKFLFEKLVELKADYVATGHYSYLRQEILNPKSEIRNKSKIPASPVGSQNPKILYKLFEGKDKNKGQSYFLYTLAQKQLPKILFPLGNYTKDKVRKIARDLKLPVSVKEESQNICFIRDKYPDMFLKRYLKMKSGNIINTGGKIIGRHEGLPLYTIGQRRGIKIGGTGPYYVVRKDRKNNQLVVTGNANDPALYRKEIFIGKANWISGEPKLPLKSLVQTRYRNPKVPAIIKLSAGRLKIEFIKPQRAIAPGQSAVFYGKNEEVIGGGIIK